MKFNILIPAIFLMLSSCSNDKSGPAVEKPEIQIPDFSGKVTYSIRFESSDTNLLQTVRPFSPEKTEVWFAKNKFRMIEHGGASRGNILIFSDKKEAWQIDTIEKTAYLGEYSDFDHPGEELMDMMPDHFAPTLEAMNATETIRGFECTKYKVTRSGFIPADDEAYIWVTDKIRFPSSRFDVQTDVNRVTVPLPLYLGYNDGAIMKMRIANKRYAAIYEIVELNNSDINPVIFNIPEGYAKK